MALLHFQCSLSLPPPISSSSRPNPNKNHQRGLPARDRTIDFGKHKGRMLGSLPSKYLLWVSKTLRARDFQHWAELADEVLADPVYRDRIEWESADRVLSGNSTNTFHAPPAADGESAVSALLEISERFGWDNEDKAGWALVDFELLGTSKGGKIPRVRDRAGGEKRREVGGDDNEFLMSGKREERRERRSRAKMMEAKLRGEEEVGFVVDEKRKKITRSENSVNPFPGRGALLDKIRRENGTD